jgi:hypothetical protein
MKEIRKKTYQAPEVQKINLVVKNAVLGTCHSSPSSTPKTLADTCITVPAGCWYGPGIG